MQEILILKMGSTFPETAAKLGDFDQWIMRALPSELHEFIQVSRMDRPFPEPRGLRGIIITGSHSMITRPNNWERKAMHWLKWALDQGVPTLGICYGHHMLAQILGGSVGYLPQGPEIGYQRLHFCGEYESDPLFGLYPSHFEAFAYHYQTILRLPAKARVYARTAQERCHAVRFDQWVWGVQYHPEFSPYAAAEYLSHDPQEIERCGLNPKQLLQETELERPPDPLIPRFVDLVLSRELE